MKILAVIPARGGSKSIPGKNIVDVVGYPLIAWTIKQALTSGVIDYIHVSTDDPMIAEVSKSFGANCEFLRPLNISGDLIGTRPAIHHTITTLFEKGYSFDLVFELQPTYCFRGSEMINKIVEIFKEDKERIIDSVITCTKVEDTSHPDYVLTVKKNGFVNFGLKDIDTFARQKLTPMLACKGVVLASRVDHYRNSQSFFSGKCVAYVIEDRIRALDINDNFDLHVVRSLASLFPNSLN